jgi:opacity protein-like surface antigen
MITGFIVVLMIFSLPGTVSAERFADLSVGLTYTQDSDLEFSSSTSSITLDTNFDPSYVIDYRLGFWFEGMPYLGLAFGADYTSVEDDQEIDVLTLTPQIMFRLPLMKSATYPTGEWAPFIAGGPGIFLSRIQYEVAESPVPNMIGQPAVRGEYKDDQIDIGLDVRAGLKKMMAPNWGLNLEYRFSWFEPEYEDNVLGSDVQTTAELYVHSFMVGVTFNY